MRRIEITKTLLDTAKAYAKDPFAGRPNTFIKPQVRLANLVQSLRLLGNQNDYIEYVQRIINEYEVLNCLLPMDVATELTSFPRVDHTKVFEIDKQRINPNAKSKTEKRPFHGWVVYAMCYEELREQVFLPYIRDVLKIKSCVYCNAQLAVVIKTDSKGNTKGCFQLDHFYPKSKYPFLCTSFFNLYPTCAVCNGSKNDKLADFVLYVKPNSEKYLSPFVFKIEPSSFLNYLNARNIEQCDLLNIEFLPADPSYKTLHEKHDKIFHISGIYETQKDIAAELIEKRRNYSLAYKKQLIRSFASLFPSQAIVDRLLIGTYPEPEHIHKRPMAKFVQDIARQIKLLR